MNPGDTFDILDSIAQAATTSMHDELVEAAERRNGDEIKLKARSYDYALKRSGKSPDQRFSRVIDAIVEGLDNE